MSRPCSVREEDREGVRWWVREQTGYRDEDVGLHRVTSNVAASFVAAHFDR